MLCFIGTCYSLLQDSGDLDEIDLEDFCHQRETHQRQDGSTSCIYCKYHKWTKAEVLTNVAMFCDQFGEVRRKILCILYNNRIGQNPIKFRIGFSVLQLQLLGSNMIS